MSEEAASASTGFVAGLSGLQRLTLVVATLISVAGAGLWGFATATAPERPEQASVEPRGESGAEGFEPNAFFEEGEEPESGDQPAEELTALELYSPTIFRLGFAFFLGFAIAYTIRTAFKILLLVVGSIALVLISLEMAGWITVNWDEMKGGYDSAAAWMGSQFQSLTAFLSGYIPSGGSAVAGFAIGMIKGK